MKYLVDFALQERYRQIKDLGDLLRELGIHIDWELFRERQSKTKNLSAMTKK
jgi:hypothetical protein